MDLNHPWQLQIFRKTLKKKEKLAIIRKLLPDLTNKRCLDLGCAKGTISYFLTREGGTWVHEDLDFSNVKATAELVSHRVAVIDVSKLPHDNASFDVIVSLDILEHIRDDHHFVSEMARVLKKGGSLILSTPSTGKYLIVNYLKNLTGLTPDKYGHVVEGYTLDHLKELLSGNNFEVVSARTYSHFFTEFIEFIINLVFIKLLSKHATSQNRDGHISPGSADEVRKFKKQLRFYSILYPFIWFVTRLDKLLFWKQGYATLLIAIRR